MKNRLLLIVAVLLANLAIGSSLYSLTTGPLKASYLNYNFDHLHNSMVGGHGGRLVNADVNTDAGISHHKLKDPQLVPKAWVSIDSCTTTASASCTIADNSGVTSVTADSSGNNGIYLVTLTRPPRRDNISGSVSVAPIATAWGAATGTNAIVCRALYFPNLYTESTVEVRCWNQRTGTLTDWAFDLVVFEEDV